MSHMDYEYTPLSSPTNIRLLHIDADTQDDRIQGKLVETQVDEKSAYVALSYVWGTNEPSFDLYFGEKVLKIRRNLFDALLRLRRRRNLVLWIDAVCINQNDLEERAKQVQIMRNIYESTIEVVFYLGEFDSHECQQIASVLDILFNFACDVLWERQNEEVIRISEIDTFKKFGIPDYRDARWQPFIRFLRHPWFSRVWTIQEGAAASKGTFLYGENEFDQEKLNLISIAINKYPSFSSYIDRTPRNQGYPVEEATARCCAVSTFRSGVIRTNRNTVFPQTVPNKRPLIALLCRTRTAQATDKRDHVFGLLGISCEANEARLQPDYSETETKERMFKRVAKYMVEHGYGPRLLRSAGFGTESADGPSWVPQWDRHFPGIRAFGPESELYVNKLYRAGNANRSAFRLVDGDRLLVTPGIVFDTVKEVDTYSKAVLKSGQTEDLNTHMFALKCMSDLVHMLIPFGAYPTNEPIAQVVCRTAISDTWDGDSATPQWALPCLIHTLDSAIENFSPPTDLDQLMRQLTIWLVKSTLGQAQGLRTTETVERGYEYLRRAFDRLSKNERCITTKGYVCQVPLNSEIGDKIVLIQGCEMPYILRPSNNEIYSIVGCCYVHGIMDGREWCVNKVCDIYLR